MQTRLYRSSTSKVIAGVCGGIGEYFEVDPVFVRILTVLLVFATGFALVAYIVAWIIMPKREIPLEHLDSAQPVNVQYSSWHKYLPGTILIGIGIILLVRENWYWFDWEEFWPLMLILGGLFLIFRGKKKLSEADAAEAAAHVNSHTPKPENGGSLS